MKQILAVLLFAVLLDNFGCSDAAIRYKRSVTSTRRFQYTFFKDLRVSWIDAYVSCLEDGDQLLYIDTNAEFDYLRNWLNKTGLPNFQNEVYWTSGSDAYDQGNFIWMSSGKPLQKTWWTAGNPSNSGGTEHCVNMYGDGGSNFFLNDDTCTKKFLYICKRRL